LSGTNTLAYFVSPFATKKKKFYNIDLLLEYLPENLLEMKLGIGFSAKGNQLSIVSEQWAC
jgi:hypothetical protein